MRLLLMTSCAIGLSLTATPALAAWDKLGTVSVDRGRDHDRVYDRFGGPVERLWFSADDGDAYCRSIRVTFGNGRTQNVFSGRLNEDRGRVVDLPGYQRNIRRIDLRCRSLDRNTSKINISGAIAAHGARALTGADGGRGCSLGTATLAAQINGCGSVAETLVDLATPKQSHLDGELRAT